MENGKVRQEKIRSLLLTAHQPLSATYFAHQFGVSRQTIVGDIALLRAGGESILATPTGYEYSRSTESLQFTVVCQHTLAQTEQELSIIVQCGGTVLNVAVDHPIYGQLSGQLTIRSLADIHLFMKHLKRFKGHLLAELTDGVHSHLIAVQRVDQMQQIQQKLEEVGILYH